MQIRTIEKGNLMQIRTIPNEFKPFETKFEAFECKFEPLKEILTIQMQIRANRTRLEAASSRAIVQSSRVKYSEVEPW